MRKKKLVIMLVLLVSFSNCKRENEKNLNRSVLEGNLIKNGEFDEWDEFWKPSSWEVQNENEKNIYVRPYEDLSVQNCVSIFKNNIREQFIYQNVKVKKNTFYFLSAELYLNTNKVYGGIYVVDIESEKLLAKNESAYKNEAKSIKLLFNSARTGVVTIKIGFLDSNGLNGNINVCSITLSESDYKQNFFESKEANELVKLLELDFSNKKEFNNSIQQLALFVNNALLAKRREDRNGMKYLKKLKEIFKSSNLSDKQIFDLSNDDIIIAYEQKVSYILEQVLLLFNIDSYVIDFRKEDKRIHTLLEYYNPYEKEKYNFIDPFFNIILESKDKSTENLFKNIKIKKMGGVYDSIELFLKRVNDSEMTNNNTHTLTYPF